MITLRKAEDRGYANHGWLKSYHSFSFANYYDPNYLGFKSLRVINEDRVSPGAGFSTHGHRDMEIITYVLEGALEHQDSLGNGSIIQPREIQRMSAGTGIFHSEYNASATDLVHFLQIWLIPQEKGITPSYAQQKLAQGESFQLLAAPTAQAGAVQINQDVWLYRGQLAQAEVLNYTLAPGRAAWLQVTRGSCDLNGIILAPGDGAAVEEINNLEGKGLQENTEFLLFDLS
jgi:redox-sensitive bicupin YhaK (pirin superfamily)